MRHSEFERLFEEHARGLLAFLVYRTGDLAAAEDIVGDTFERAVRARRRFDRRKSSEKTWLYAIALNCLRDQARRGNAEGRALERMGALAAPAVAAPAGEGVAERDELQRALAALAPEEREAIGLRYGGELTVPEMAKLKREPTTTMESRLYRALRKLREQMG